MEINFGEALGERLPKVIIINEEYGRNFEVMYGNFEKASRRKNFVEIELL